ncbi:MAG: DUF3857 domain-containing protein [Ginsengibacter sp.]
MKKLFVVCFTLVSAIIKAQDYNVLLIPDSLVKNANAVKRFEELHVVVKNIGKAVIKHKYAITILNESGDEYATYVNYYDKLTPLSDISGHLYDAFGKKMRSVKKKDISNTSVDDGFSLLTDNRQKKYSFYCKTYPYTVEFEDEQELDGIYYFPSWQPVEDEHFAVQQSRLVVETPENYKLRYKQFNYVGGPVINKKGKTTYTWQLLNKPELSYEVFQPSVQEITTGVYLAPSEFEFGGYTGDMSTWNGLGKFQVSLNKGRDELPVNIKKDIHDLTDRLNSNEEKIKVLYNYFQQNTRYISIQLGIGGWQPFEAKYVAANKFGDCKALSNYMISMLKEAGIYANYVIINAGKGRRGLWEDFPSPYFNHVIMCAPDKTDTLWLECTSQTVSAGYMGTFTGNRKALMITDDGGVVVNTPGCKASDNVQIRKTSAIIDQEGNLTAEVNTRFAGTQQETPHSLLYDATPEQRNRYLNKTLNLPTFKIEKTNYTETKGRMPLMDEHLQITSPLYASVTGKRLFIQPNLFNKKSKLSIDKPRQFDIEYKSSYKDVDSISIKIPEGYTSESVPKNADITNKFGKYSITCKVMADKIELVRTYEQSAGRFPPGDYPELVKFYEQMFKSDRAKVVLVKN